MIRTWLLATATFLAGTTPLVAQTAFTTPYYPLNVGDKWTYRAIDLKAPAAKVDRFEKVVIEVERQDVYKYVKDKDEKAENIGYILKNSSGGKTTRDYVIVLSDGVHRIHLAETPITPSLLFFKIVKGVNSWTVNSKTGNTEIKGMFSVREEKVSVPAGKFDAFVASFTNEKKDKIERVEVDTWFAMDIGMVKQRTLQKGRETALELESYVTKK